VTPTSYAAQVARSQPVRASGARSATVQIETRGSKFLGRLYVPETMSASDVLLDDHPFVFLTQVRVGGSAQVEPFLAISKQFVRRIRILDDDESDGIEPAHLV
jgi:hypothetical protein